MQHCFVLGWRSQNLSGNSSLRWFNCSKTFLLLPQYLTLCSWPSYFTVTTPLCCYHNIWHCVLDLHILLWQHLSVVTTIFDIVFLTFIFYCDNTFVLLPQYLTLWSWPSYFTVTRLFCCYHNIWHCVLDLHILLWQHLSVFITIFDIAFLIFIFYCDNTFMLLPQYFTLCSWPSYFTVTTPLCCYHNIWHCVLDLHILLWQDLSVVTIIFDIVFLTFIFYCDNTFLLLPQYLTLCSWPSYFTVTTLLCCYHNIWHCVLDLHILLWQHFYVVTTIFDIVFLTFIFYCDNTFLLLPQYLTLCSWPSYFTVTTPLCCYHNIWHCVLDLHILLWQHFYVVTMYHNIWHCVLDLHILLWQHLSVVTTIFDIVFLTFIFYCDNTFLFLSQYLTLRSWSSYFTVTRPFCCYHNIWHCVLDLHILLWQHLYVVTIIFDIVFWTFIFYCDNTFMLLPQYLTLCSGPSYFTVTTPFCCYPNILHCVLDIDILLWKDLFCCYHNIWHCVIDLHILIFTSQCFLLR